MTDGASRVAVVGAGSIGTLVGARIHAGGHDVTLCLRSPVECIVVESLGERSTVSIRCATEPSQVGPVDWVLLATKSQDTEGAAGWLTELAGPDVAVVALQNGVDHRERLAPLVPAGTPVLPALVYANVERVAPDHIIHRAGELIIVPEQQPEAERLAAVMARGGLEVRTEDDFLTASWNKLLGNVAGNPITTLTMRRAEVLQDPDVLELAAGLLREAVAVGRAEGARLDEDDVQATLANYATFPPDAGTSMLFDRLNGRRLEHEAITGAVVRRAAAHGIAVPLNQAILTLLRAVDQSAGGAAREA